jgi:hypothetical protein
VTHAIVAVSMFVQLEYDTRGEVLGLVVGKAKELGLLRKGRDTKESSLGHLTT